MSAYIYGIKNNKNNLWYIGQTVNLISRKSKHFTLLKRDAHPNQHLQNAYNKYGAENFSFIILEEFEDSISPEELGRTEIDWIAKMGYYNIEKGGNGLSFLTRKAMSEAHIGQISSRRILNKEQVYDYLSMEEFIGNMGRPFARFVNCNRIVPREILSGKCYQEFSKEYLSFDIEKRLDIFYKSIKKYNIEISRLTDKTASIVWFLYKNKQMKKQEIANLFQKDIRSIERILRKDTLIHSYDFYISHTEDFLEKMSFVILENIVPSSKEKV